MRARLLLTLLAISAVAIFALFVNRRPTESSRPRPLPAPATVEAPASSALPVAEIAAPGGAAVPASPVAGTVVAIMPEVQTEMETVKFFIRDYRAALGENPVGNNAEITKTLMGANPKHTKLVGPGDSRVSTKGELVDSWGMPYFFHALSAREMEIRSAGPDKRMWTGDDIVLR